MFCKPFSALLLGLLPGLAAADVPRVVTDIGPVHSLVSMVMSGLGTPDLLLEPGASPHDFALQPAQARIFSEAGLVVWIGPELTPQLARQIDSHAGEASHLMLAAAEGTWRLPFREGGLFAYEHGHDGRDEDAHAQDAYQAEPADAPAHLDPHLWLAPGNGALWISVIADELARLDPAHADHYHVNAVKAANRIAAAESQARDTLAPARGVPLGVAHDAFQYFEAAFGLTVIGAITDGDDAAPGAARLDRLRDAYAETPPECFLAEPGSDTRLLLAIAREPLMGKEMLLGALDPMGAALPQGAALYPALIEDIASRIADCVTGD